MIMRRLAALVFGVLLCPGSASAVAEMEPNDSFDTSQIVSADDREIVGEIEDMISDPDLSFTGALSPGGVFVPSPTVGFTPGEPYIGWVDNDIDASPDTLLGRFDTMGALADSNEDASPIGTGTASALLANVDSDGEIRLKLTGTGDAGFDGSHSETGEVDVLIEFGQLDLDFFTYPDLVPGREFDVELQTSDSRKTLLWLDDNGDPIDTRFLEFPFSIEGTVPGSGTLHFAVTGGEDRDADGAPDTGPGADDRVGIGAGSYTLVLVPEPSGVGLRLAAVAAVVLLSGAHRRRLAVRVPESLDR
jgi:hypothetical protein